MVGDRAIGVISVQSIAEVGRFGDGDVRLLSTIAANVATAIQNARLYQEIAASGRRDGRPQRRRPRDHRDARPATASSNGSPSRRGRSSRRTRAPSSSARWGRRGGLPAARRPRRHRRRDHGRPDPPGEGHPRGHRHARRGRGRQRRDHRPPDARHRGHPGTDEHRRATHGRLAGRHATASSGSWPLAWRDGRPFTDEDLDFLVGLSQQAAIAIDNARLFARRARPARWPSRPTRPRAPSWPP